MGRLLVTVPRIRSILADARTEQDAMLALRQHRVRYSFSTAGGVFHIRIPARAGAVTVTRTASRSAPLRIAAAAPTGPAPYPYPVPRWTWDD
jgi:hypothetical protein